MKISFALSLCAATLLLGAAGCSSKPDSVEQAQQINNEQKGITNADTVVATNKGVSGTQRPAFDSEFMTEAASGGMLEVQLGREVARRATTPEVKQFAQQMVTDHTKNSDELKALAAKKNITLPTTLGKDQQKVYDDVLAEKGAALDKKYVAEMLTDHQEDISKYQTAVTQSNDSEIKAYASRSVPVLQEHLGMLKKIQPVVEAKKD